MGPFSPDIGTLQQANDPGGGVVDTSASDALNSLGKAGMQFFEGAVVGKAKSIASDAEEGITQGLDDRNAEAEQAQKTVFDSLNANQKETFLNNPHYADYLKLSSKVAAAKAQGVISGDIAALKIKTAMKGMLNRFPGFGDEIRRVAEEHITGVDNTAVTLATIQEQLEQTEAEALQDTRKELMTRAEQIGVDRNLLRNSPDVFFERMYETEEAYARSTRAKILMDTTKNEAGVSASKVRTLASQSFTAEYKNAMINSGIVVSDILGHVNEEGEKVPLFPDQLTPAHLNVLIGMSKNIEATMTRKLIQQKAEFTARYSQGDNGMTPQEIDSYFKPMEDYTKNFIELLNGDTTLKQFQNVANFAQLAAEENMWNSVPGSRELMGLAKMVGLGGEGFTTILNMESFNDSFEQQRGVFRALTNIFKHSTMDLPPGEGGQITSAIPDLAEQMGVPENEAFAARAAVNLGLIKQVAGSDKTPVPEGDQNVVNRALANGLISNLRYLNTNRDKGVKIKNGAKLYRDTLSQFASEDFKKAFSMLSPQERNAIINEASSAKQFFGVELIKQLANSMASFTSEAAKNFNWHNSKPITTKGSVDIGGYTPGFTYQRPGNSVGIDLVKSINLGKGGLTIDLYTDRLEELSPEEQGQFLQHLAKIKKGFNLTFAELGMAEAHLSTISGNVGNEQYAAAFNMIATSVNAILGEQLSEE